MGRAKEQWLRECGGHSPFSLEGKLYMDKNSLVKKLLEKQSSDQLNDSEMLILQEGVMFLHNLAVDDYEFD